MEPEGSLGTTIAYWRHTRGWTQKKLAQLADIPLRTLQDYETARLGTKRPNARILQQLADALKIEVHLLNEAVTRRRFIASGTGATASILLAPALHAPSRASATAVQDHELYAEAENHLFKGEWPKAADKALQLAARHPRGSRERAVPALYLAALAYEQAGAVAHTEEVIRTIEREDGEADHPDLAVRALAANRRGWLYVEHYGLFEPGIELLTNSLHAAKCCDAGLAYRPDSGHLPLPLKLQVGTHHWLLIAHTHKAMAEARSYLSAYPGRRRVPSLTTLAVLQQSLEEDWSSWIGSDEENPAQYYRKFEADALLNPQQAWSNWQASVRDHSSAFKDSDADHLLNLVEARRFLVHTEWAEDNLAEAMAKASAARLGYCRARFPPGISLCSAIEARAQFQRGLDRILKKEDKVAAHTKCLDRLVLAIVLQHFKMHPLWGEAAGLIYAVCRSASSSFGDDWLREYKADLPDRIAQCDGIFDALKNLNLTLSVEPVGELEIARAHGVLYWGK
jgi:transcriptional regulator with XRE-family HTH domain